jgi:hypothetical protein
MARMTVMSMALLTAARVMDSVATPSETSKDRLFIDYPLDGSTPLRASTPSH